ncbi:unnamed protein product [Tilletia laevis]|uniref:O-methyltransferase C-terminal domain-containing protein n=2 Tax=Tilletia TaxID=13289 RepID=A0A177UQT8_9BASI|nr:hypothetical protein CF335_g1499 [Tilletia laevis]KAE8263145.1 hypothetical protein A4X03_0g1902 [Tilletia caries]CAD6891007.1 unnamed protein product [Tilletia caries]CAD6896135.1 unnamed protein product [Tilletia laevis]CAD6900472.1 unnamed protein product [Tilletia caries]
MSSPESSYAYLRALSTTLNRALASYESHLSPGNAGNLDLENPVAKRPDDSSKSMAEARWACLNALDVLRATLQSPVDAMYQTYTSTHELAALGVVIKFGVVDSMYDSATQSGDEMTGVPVQVLAEKEKLERLLRLLAVRHWFRETSEGCFQPTRHGAALRAGQPVAAYIATHATTIFASMHEFPITLRDPISRDSDSEHQTAFARGPGQGTFWEHLTAHPDAMRDFGLSMQASGEIQLAASLREFPWRKRLQDKMLVDVGGGAGHFSVQFAKMNIPGLNIVVQDRPGTFELAQQHFAKTVPDFVADGRAEFEQGDFFAPNPRKGENVCYLLRSILHDWSDEHCVKILSNLANSMHPSSSIFVHDALLRPCLPPNPASRPSSPTSPVLDHAKNAGVSHNDMLKRHSIITPPLSDAGNDSGDAAGSKSYDAGSSGGGGGSNGTAEAPWPIPRNFGPNTSQVCGLDLLMLLELNGRERTEAQIRSIAERAGLELVHTTSLTSGRGIFEIRLPS